MIKIAFIQNMGQVIADVEENLDGTFTFDKPVVIMPGPSGVQMAPLLMLTEETSLTLSKSEIMFGAALFDPIKELRNQYNSQYGSGIQLVGG